MFILCSQMAPTSHSQAVLPNPDVLALERVDASGGNSGCSLSSLKSRSVRCAAAYRGSGIVAIDDCRIFLRKASLFTLCVTAHRYRCRNAACPRKVFCERLPCVARSHARQTDRTSEIVRLVGYVSGGRPGQRLLLRLAIETSDDTVLRRVKQPRVPECVEHKTIRNLGVDDWAWRKGHNDGTILVDLDLHRVADLLADRSSESLAGWLQQHVGIATIARDRCGVYAEGARIGAASVQQVADRFHLIVNLTDEVERVSRNVVENSSCRPKQQRKRRRLTDHLQMRLKMQR